MSKNKLYSPSLPIGPLQDPVTWYRLDYAGTQITHWDLQNKGKLDWTGKSSFALKVPLRFLRPSIIYSVPGDRIVQSLNKPQWWMERPAEKWLYTCVIALPFSEKQREMTSACTWARLPPLSRVWFANYTPRVSSEKERGLLSRAAAGNRAYVYHAG